MNRNLAVPIVAIVGLATFVAAADLSATRPATQPSDLAAFRVAYPMQLLHRSDVPTSLRDSTPLKLPAGVHETTFLSDKLRLHAWISDTPTDQISHPAIVLCHEGHWFSNEDWDIARVLTKAGFVVLMPQLRGENGNPGDFSFFGGEVDDVIAAGRTLADLPGVDRKRLFVAGIGDGGTLAALVAECDSPFAMAAAMDPQVKFWNASDFGPHANDIAAVFDAKDQNEMKQRSSVDFVESLRIPLKLTFSGNVAPVSALLFTDKAHHFQKSVTLTKLGERSVAALMRVLPTWIDEFIAYAPGRRVRLDPPAGWVVTPRPGRNEQAGQMPTTGAIYAMSSRPKDSFRADLQVPEFAGTMRDGQTKAAKASGAVVGDLARHPLPNLPDAMTFDVTQTQNGRVLRQRVYVASTPHFFVYTIFVATAKEFDRATDEFDRLAGRVAEIHD